jgi:hypothetical protein
VDSPYGEFLEIFMHPLWPCMYVGNDHLYGLPKHDITGWTTAVFLLFRRVLAHHEIDRINDANTHALQNRIYGESRGIGYLPQPGNKEAYSWR